MHGFAGGPLKPRHIGGYSSDYTSICERTLLTLVARLGPWAEHIYVIGGLVPRYLIEPRRRGTDTQPTMDVDLVLDVELMTTVEAYRSLERNLEGIGFRRDTNDRGDRVNHRWVYPIDDAHVVAVDLLCSNESAARRAVPVTHGVSALAIPGAHLVRRDFVSVHVQGALLGEGGITTETIRVANVVPFLVLKALAYRERREPKDAHDIIYVLSNMDGGPDAAARDYADRLRDWQDEPLLTEALQVFRVHFGSDRDIPGRDKNGCVSYASFHVTLGDHKQDARLRNEAGAIIDRFLRLIEPPLSEG